MALLVLLAALVLWAVLGQLDIVAVAEGKLVPQSYLKIVQPPESGIVKETPISNPLRNLDSGFRRNDDFSFVQRFLNRVLKNYCGGVMRCQKQAQNAHLLDVNSASSPVFS